METRYHVYQCSDNRTRVYDSVTKKVTSFPRMIMELFLGRELKENEEVHHIDGDPKNNDLTNLEVVDGTIHRRVHQTKYTDKEMTCPMCGKTFIWSAKSQLRQHQNQNRKIEKSISGPFCSKHCAGLHSRLEQLGRDA